MVSKINKLLFCCLILFAVSKVGQAQDLTVEGTVVEAEAKEPLPGVNILVKGTTTGASTGANGNFELMVPSLQDTLVVTYIGYQRQEVPINGRTEVNIQLTPEAIMGEEMVVVGYGIQKEENVTGSISNISSDDIEARPVTNVTSALQGTMSGVTVTQSSGQPGKESSDINIRGIGTLNNSNPLIVVDGIVSSLDDVNPDDIADVTVLKDAASAAIYGSRAANGVVLIKTKEGVEGKTTIHYKSYVGKQKATRLPEFVPSWQAAELYNQALKNEGRTPKYTDEDIQKFKSGEYPDEYPNTNWKDLLYGSGNGIQQKHYVDISGGSDDIQYMLSLNYYDQNGIIKNSENQKYTSRLNLTSQVLEDRLSVNAKFAYTQGQFKEPTNPYTGDASQIFRQVNRISRTVPYKYSNGYYGFIGDGNPIAWLDEGGVYKEESNYIRGSIDADLKIIKGLHFKPMLGYRGTIGRSKRMVKDIQFYNHRNGEPSLYQGPNELTDQDQFNKVVTLQGLLEYSNSFDDKHNIDLLAGYSQEYTKHNNLQGFRKDFLNNQFSQLDVGPPSGQTNSGGAHELALQSFFGRVNYNYKNKYLLEGNLRYDGSSRFANGQRWGLYPSFSAGWNISNERFFDPVKSWLSNLKLRASWGQLGNQKIGDIYPYISTVSSGLDYTFNNSNVSGIAPTNGANHDISWEETTQTNIGLEMAFMQGKVTFDADYFVKKTNDILLDIPVGASYGLDPPVQNAGAVRNKGWEFTAGYHENIGEWSYDISSNISFIDNEITDLHETGPIIDGFNFKEVGFPINSFYGYEVEGIFQSEQEVADHATQSGGDIGPGDLMYKDLNDDGVIDGNDRTYLGTYTPKVTYGVNLGLNWKGINLNVFIQGATGVKGFVQEELLGQVSADAGKPTTILRDAWTPENHSTQFPRLWDQYTQNKPGANPSSFWVRDASYLRLKNLELGYTLPQTWTQQIGLGKAKIYYSGQNLITISPFYDWVDPEAPAGERGYTYPQVLVNTIGINLTF